MGEFLFSFPQLVFKMAISRNYGLLITTPVTTTTLKITICSPESTKQEQHVQPLTLSWEIHVALRHWPSKPDPQHISSMKDVLNQYDVMQFISIAQHCNINPIQM